MRSISIEVLEALRKITPRFAVYKEFVTFNGNERGLVHLSIFVPEACLEKAKMALYILMDTIYAEGADTEELLPGKESCPMTLQGYSGNEIKPGVYEIYDFSNQTH